MDGRGEVAFTTSEALGLVTKLARAGFAESIKLDALEPRPGNSDRPWRISCVLGGRGVFAEVAELQRDAGVEAVLDGDRSVLFHHAEPGEARAWSRASIAGG